MKYRLHVMAPFAAAWLHAVACGAAFAQAQPQEPAATAAQPPYTVQYENHLSVRQDRTATELSTKRIKILTPGAAQTLSQQQFSFIEGMETIETVEAFTEKSDGRRIPVDPANIITRDGASNQQATFLRDSKTRTIIFPDVSVGDTLVMTNRSEILENVFPGQFMDSDVFPRSLSLSSVHVTIEAPDSLDLAVKATGLHTTDDVEVVDGMRRHEVTIIPEPFAPDEPGAVSPFDREPELMVSTFHSYDELGRAYGDAAFPKSVATPEIAALADEITKNIDGHRAQAAAIDAWMKKNIRYVAVYLSVGRVVPHDAEAVLHNKYGDCKDKVTLMRALLAAKGIDSEEALINLGNSYILPEPPTLATLNHVILFLPEFDVYDDPTANSAAFGVLAAEAYDKPVVRVSETRAELARTPAMKPDDHVAHAYTTIEIAADGTITGRTREENTGILGAALRYAAGVVQQLGDDKVVQRQLQAFNTPGNGHVDLGNSNETLDPAGMQSSYTLNDRFKTPAPGGVAWVPVGMPFTLRPGFFFFGSRLGGRQSPFECYAGTQIEDIDATFGSGLPLPAVLPSTLIDNPYFTYRSSYQVRNRTLKVHRELVSHVPGQTCAPETETEIAADLNKVHADVNSFTYRFPGGPRPPQRFADAVRTLEVGQKRQLDFFYETNLDCSSQGVKTVIFIQSAQHGKALAGTGTGTASFPDANPRSACNGRKNEGALISYDPAPDFVGEDAVAVRVVFADGGAVERHYKIVVARGPAPALAPSETTSSTPPVPTSAAPAGVISRVAVVDQPLRVGFLYALNPDCSSIGIPTLRILESPKSGQAKVEPGTGFPNFPSNNMRFKCNGDRAQGAILSYMPNAGYTGDDSIAVEIIYPDGTETQRRYAIVVK